MLLTKSVCCPIPFPLHNPWQGSLGTDATHRSGVVADEIPSGFPLHVVTADLLGLHRALQAATNYHGTKRAF